MAIDFDGTNDGYTADISVLTATGGTFAPVFAQLFFNFDTNKGTKTLLYLVNSGDANKFCTLEKSATTLTWKVSDISVPTSVTASVSITDSTWTGCQVYATGAVSIGIRVWTTGSPPAFTTNTGSFTFPANLDTLYVAHKGSTSFYDGRLAELYLAEYDSSLSSQWQKVVDGMAVIGNPLSVLPPLWQDTVVDNGVDVGLYWPMRVSSSTALSVAGNQTDQFHKAVLTAVDSPSEHPSHPRIYLPGDE